MTTTYSAVVTGSFVAGQDSVAIEIDAAANETIKIKKIRITDTDGTNAPTNMNDYYRKVKLVVESATATGTSAYTAVDTDDNSSPSTSTVKIGPGTPGTISTTIDVLSLHSTTDFIWQAADEDDKIVITPGGIFAVVVNPAA